MAISWIGGGVPLGLRVSTLASPEAAFGDLALELDCWPSTREPASRAGDIPSSDSNLRRFIMCVSRLMRWMAGMNRGISSAADVSHAVRPCPENAHRLWWLQTGDPPSRLP